MESQNSEKSVPDWAELLTEKPNRNSKHVAEVELKTIPEGQSKVRAIDEAEIQNRMEQRRKILELGKFWLTSEK